MGRADSLRTEAVGVEAVSCQGSLAEAANAEASEPGLELECCNELHIIKNPSLVSSSTLDGMRNTSCSAESSSTSSRELPASPERGRSETRRGLHGVTPEEIADLELVAQACQRLLDSFEQSESGR